MTEETHDPLDELLMGFDPDRDAKAQLMEEIVELWSHLNKPEQVKGFYDLAYENEKGTEFGTVQDPLSRVVYMAHLGKTDTFLFQLRGEFEGHKYSVGAELSAKETLDHLKDAVYRCEVKKYIYDTLNGHGEFNDPGELAAIYLKLSSFVMEGKERSKPIYRKCILDIKDMLPLIEPLAQFAQLATLGSAEEELLNSARRAFKYNFRKAADSLRDDSS